MIGKSKVFKCKENLNGIEFGKNILSLDVEGRKYNVIFGCVKIWASRQYYTYIYISS